MFQNDAQKGGLVISPKTSFVLGLVGGALVLCAIGFFILLAAFMSGKAVSKDDKQVVPAAQPAAVAPTPAPAAAAPAGDLAPVTAADHVRGSKDAVVTLVEYSDMQCPYCKNFHATMTQVMTAYSGKVKWVFRHFPLSFHPNAQPAALAAECASEQGKFWEFTDAMYTNQADLGDALYTKTAADLKLNKTKFAACVASKKYASVIAADQASGSTAGVDGTPATFILAKDGTKTMIPGALPFEQVKPMIDAALAK